jgi:hypothetical protein
MDNGTASQSLPEILKLIDDTIDALVRLDSNTLIVLEQQASEHPSHPLHFGTEMVRILQNKKALLGCVLEETAANLDLVRRLYGRKEEARWVR